MFNRNNYSMPNPFGSQPPHRDGYSRPQGNPPRDQSHPPMSGGYGAPPPRQMGTPGSQPPPPRVPIGGRPMGGGEATWVLTATKNKAFEFDNVVAISPQDFPRSHFQHDDFFIILKNLYVFTARILDGFPAGRIGMTDPQRTWAGVVVDRDHIEVQIYEPFAQGGEAYLGSTDIEVGFAGKGKTKPDTPYEQDELSHAVIKNFQNQLFAPGQRIVMNYQGVPLLLIVKAIQRIDLNSEKSAPGQVESEASSRGILTPHTLITFFKDARSVINIKPSNNRPVANAIIQPDFKFENMGIGGLDSEFFTIFRRAFASRIFPPGLVAKLGIQHVKGILLYGPPGTGKTLLARQIGKMLNAREPKIINGPEVLNKFVGQSEENIRKLFADAEKEYKEKGDASELHIIIFDELDAVCKQRGSGTGGGTGVGDSVVNQLLSKLDGVDQLNNILLIGMTNRKDMIDDALLRPGRLEVHVEISLPDEAGRAQILGIHTQNMRESKLMDENVDLGELAFSTKNFSGAEIAGLVKSATSFAFNRHVEFGKGVRVKEDVADMKVNQNDFRQALDEIQPAFGVSEDELKRCIQYGIIKYSSDIDKILKEGELFVKQVGKTDRTPLLSVMLYGPPASGKTALAAQIALDSGFPFIKMLCPEDMVGFSEMAKVQHISKIFNDAYKSQTSVVVVDAIERIIDYVSKGPRFSNTVLQTLIVFLRKQPIKGRRLLVIVTTTEKHLMEELGIYNSINSDIMVPNVTSSDQLKLIMEDSEAFNDVQIESALEEIGDLKDEVSFGVGIKKVLLGIETARQEDSEFNSLRRFVNVINKAIDRKQPEIDNYKEGFLNPTSGQHFIENAGSQMALTSGEF